MSNPVRQAKLPQESLLWPRVHRDDFLDCFAVRSDMLPRDAAEIIVSFPPWARALLLLRKMITMPFGLSQDGPPASDKIGAFPVEHASDTEIVAGFDDKHLEFRVSVMSQNDSIYLATWVHTHNLGGRVYLNSIMPFHIMISRDALQRVASAT